MRTQGVRKEANVRYWSGTEVMDFFLFGHHLGRYICPFPLTPAKSIGDDQTISNGVANC